MDTLHSVIFYAFAAVTVAGGLATALLGGRERALGIAAVAIGLAGLYADLGAGFAALVTLIALGASAAILLRLAGVVGLPEEASGGPARQVGAVLAALTLAVLAYAAFRGSYFSGRDLGGGFNAAALGRLLLGRDALAVEAVAAALLVATIAARVQARGRAR